MNVPCEAGDVNAQDIEGPENEHVTGPAQEFVLMFIVVPAGIA